MEKLMRLFLGVYINKDELNVIKYLMSVYSFPLYSYGSLFEFILIKQILQNLVNIIK